MLLMRCFLSFTVNKQDSEIWTV